MSRYWYRSMVISGLLPLMFATGTTRAQDPELTVFVYDYAGLPGGTMGELGEVTELLLSQAGVDAHWILCRGVTLGPPPGECAGALQSGEIALRILRIAA